MHGTMVEDLEFEVRDGRITNVKAAKGAEAVRAELATDENASRLGELALVDGSSAVGKLGLIFSNTLFDENATSHIAYGSGFDYAVEDEKDRAEG
jgi:aminopeptidase